MTSTPVLELTEVSEADTPAADSLNDSFWRLDSVVQMAIISRTTSAPPAAPIQGDRYIIPAGATGDWAGRTHHVAYRSPEGWEYRIPRPGWRAWSLIDAELLVFTGTAWQVFTRGTQSMRATWVRAGAAIELPVTLIPHYCFTAKRVLGVAIMTVDGPGDCQVDLRKGAIADYPDSSSICNGNLPTISAGHTLIDTTLTDWDLSLGAGEFLLLTLEAVATFTYVGVQVELGENLE